MARQTEVKTIEQLAKEYQAERKRLGKKWKASRQRGRRAQAQALALRLAFKEDEVK